MKAILARQSRTRVDQTGINMVDLMMWLVIAALLLAAAIQSIGYYQRAAIIYQMENDVTQAANTTAATASLSGAFTREGAAEAIGSTKSSSNKITLIAAVTPWSADEVMITAKHPEITKHYVMYLFKEHSPYKVGVNLVTKEAMDSSVSGGGASLDQAAPLFSVKPITIKLNPSYCMDKRDADGIVFAKPCDGADRQNWTWSGNGPLLSGAAKSLCVQPDVNSVLRTAACDNSDTQKFEYRKASNWYVEMYHPKSGRCVERSGGYLNTGGEVISLGSCVDQDWQRWGMNVSTKKAAPFVTVQNSEACLDNYGGSLANGNAQVVWSCNQNAAQLFSWNGNGQIYLGTGESKCLDVTGDKVQLWECNSNPTQTFVSRNVNGKQLSIYSPVADKCIGYTSGATYGDMQLTFTSCNTTTNQQWVYNP